MKYTRYIPVFCFIGIAFLSGCGENVGLYGRVSFPDGKPLHKGTVYLRDDTKIAWGDIGSDGSYKIGTLKSGDGVVPGRYAVYVEGAFDVEEIPPPEKEDDPTIDPKKTPLIDTRLMSPESSGIFCEVKKGMKLPFDITVDYPTAPR